MDPVTAVGAAGSVVGIVGFGIQLCEVLYRFSSQVRSAQESLEAVHHGIGSATSALQEILRFLEWERTNISSGNKPKLFSEKSLVGARDTAHKCLIIFWKVEATIANRSTGNLATRLIDFTKEVSDNPARVSEGTIKIDPRLLSSPLSLFERLRWPLITPKLDEYSRQLQQYQISLVLLFQVISLGEQRRRPNNDLNLFIKTYAIINQIATEEDLQAIVSDILPRGDIPRLPKPSSLRKEPGIPYHTSAIPSFPIQPPPENRYLPTFRRPKRKMQFNSMPGPSVPDAPERRPLPGKQGLKTGNMNSNNELLETDTLFFDSQETPIPTNPKSGFSEKQESLDSVSIANNIEPPSKGSASSLSKPTVPPKPQTTAETNKNGDDKRNTDKEPDHDNLVLVHGEKSRKTLYERGDPSRVVLTTPGSTSEHDAKGRPSSEPQRVSVSGSTEGDHVYDIQVGPTSDSPNANDSSDTAIPDDPSLGTSNSRNDPSNSKAPKVVKPGPNDNSKGRGIAKGTSEPYVSKGSFNSEDEGGDQANTILSTSNDEDDDSEIRIIDPDENWREAKFLAFLIKEGIAYLLPASADIGLKEKILSGLHLHWWPSRQALQKRLALLSKDQLRLLEKVLDSVGDGMGMGNRRLVRLKIMNQSLFKRQQPGNTAVLAIVENNLLSSLTAGSLSSITD